MVGTKLHKAQQRFDWHKSFFQEAITRKGSIYAFSSSDESTFHKISWRQRFSLTLINDND